MMLKAFPDIFNSFILTGDLIGYYIYKKKKGFCKTLNGIVVIRPRELFYISFGNIYSNVPYGSFYLTPKEYFQYRLRGDLDRYKLVEEENV